jgi:hypothetical protein
MPRQLSLVIPFVMFHFLDSTSRTPGADAATEIMHSRLPVGRALMWSPAKPLAVSLNGVPFLDSGSQLRKGWDSDFPVDR